MKPKEYVEKQDKNITIGNVTLTYIGLSDERDARNAQELFAVHGGGIIRGRANATAAARRLARMERGR